MCTCLHFKRFVKVYVYQLFSTFKQADCPQRYAFRILCLLYPLIVKTFNPGDTKSTGERNRLRRGGIQALKIRNYGHNQWTWPASTM